MTPDTLRAALERALYRLYGLTPREANGLFQDDALAYWVSTGLSPESVLAQTCGAPLPKPIRGRVA